MKKNSTPVTNKLTPIAWAVGVMVFAGSVSVQAQEKPEVQQVNVSGVRAALQKSLTQKRNAESLVEVVTAEDIGKMPDKNIADAVQRLPGVTISSAGASEGGFDENDRVSMRGTNPSLTQTMINGHSVASGDWFILNQIGTVGRSVSYSLLPSQLVGSVIVNKSSQADLVEGGVAGTVNIITRKPLDFKDALTLEGTLGAVYSDLPKKTDPQISALFNWKNEQKTFGVMLQAFSEKRSLRRDGQEMLGYSQIAAGSTIAKARPDLAGVYYPNAIGSALFEQTRKREGGLLTLQFRPSKDLNLEFTAFNSQMKATNYNRNYLVWMEKALGKGEGLIPDAYTVRNNTLVSATFNPVAGKQYVVVDQIYRPGASSETSFYNFAGKFKVNDDFTLSGQAGYTKGTGDTPKQAVYEGDVFGTGLTYQLNGLGRPADASLPNGNPANFAGTKLDWIFGASPGGTKDEETWAQLDGEYKLNTGFFTRLKVGARFAEHKRSSTWIAQGPLNSANPFDAANAPAWNGQTYPSDFGSGLGSANFPKNAWQIPADVLLAWSDKFSNRDPITRRYFAGEFELKEKNNAAYAMASMEGEKWSGNVGLRFVQTKEDVLVNVAIPSAVCPELKPCPQVPGAITTSAFGSFYQKRIQNTYNDVLPSLNLRVDLNKDIVGRFALTRTLSRPDFSALGGSISLDDTNHTGSGGNPNLKPIVSNNFDAGVEWYFAPKSMVSLGAFYMDLKSYVSFGTQNMSFLDIRTGKTENYLVTVPTNKGGNVKGFELSYQQPIGSGFGVLANYTYADGKENGGGDLVGNSKHTYNLTGYFENDSFNARLAYNYRSAFYNGLDRSSAQYQDATGTLAASLGYKINDKLSINVDALNLNNPTLKYYSGTSDRPYAFYNNGRQFYVSLRGKL